ncbi:hypothetical protein TWF788_002685 [Orbilia oligospora]|uniref:DUF6594 domain-containing protein n=1 Tax=Orbilia oligospora TaxID=2813651 RepID=A0A7C8U2N8_ORBOL|nr:hypothetical protein TWF788_002685 [Orbilia oligospora]
MSNNSAPAENHVHDTAQKTSPENKGKLKEASTGPLEMRDIDIVTYDEVGTIQSHTRIIELVASTPQNPLSIVAVTKLGNPPYLATADFSRQNIQEQVDSQDPSNTSAQTTILPTLINIPEQNVSNQDIDVQGMNRMIKIPLQIPTSRDPNANTQGRGNGYSTSHDPEKDVPVKGITYAPGYPSTAAIISTDPELSVYRRFDRLNARNFLYYQAELMYLESELDKLDEEDNVKEEAEGKYHLRHFTELWEGTNPRTLKRKRLIMDMRYLLKEYNISMVQYKDLLNCSEPSDRVLTSIRNWRRNQGDPPIIDISETAYDKCFESDLMALKPPKSDDPITIFVQNNLGRFFKKPKPPQIPNSDNVLYYSETAIDLFVTIICTLLAIVVLVGSMTTLYFVESQGLRLGLVWVFTFLFAISIFLMANLSKGEIFLATAAYCAILVVYISGG